MTNLNSISERVEWLQKKSGLTKRAFSLGIVSKCLGHSSLVTTQKAYAQILDKTIVAAFAKMEKSGG